MLCPTYASDSPYRLTAEDEAICASFGNDFDSCSESHFRDCEIMNYLTLAKTQYSRLFRNHYRASIAGVEAHQPIRL